MKLKRHFFRFLLFLPFFCLFKTSPAQEVEKPEKRTRKFEANEAVFITPNYTAQVPFGNMSDRFGFNSLFGLQIAYKTKTNWIIGGEGAFLYGTTVKEGFVVNNISGTSGQFINQNGELVNVRPQEVGFNIKFTAGKVIPFSKKFPDAGLLLLTSAGFLEHKIAFNVNSNELPQLNKTYRRGYDRLSSGPVLSQFIGGVFTKRGSFISGYAGFQFDIAFTQGRRPYDFFLKAPLHDNRVDMFIGFRIGWIIPIFLQASEKEYFYY
jgi:hypothetical protein